jgi:hypothetical protein
VARYAFTAEDFHLVPPAGLPAHPSTSSAKDRAWPKPPSDARSIPALPSDGDIDSPRSITTNQSAFRATSRPTRPSSSSPSRVAGPVWPGLRAAAAAKPPSAASRPSRFQSWWLATAAAPRSTPSSLPRRRQPEGGARRANSAFDRFLLRQRRGHHRLRQTHQAQNPRPARARQPQARRTAVPHQQRQRQSRTPQRVDATLPWRRNRKLSHLSQLAANPRSHARPRRSAALDRRRSGARALSTRIAISALLFSGESRDPGKLSPRPP